MPVFSFADVIRYIFCHAHVSFLAKTLFTTVILVRPVTSADHICRVFSSVYCAASISRHFSYRRHENVTNFPLTSSDSLSFSWRKFDPPLLTSKLNLSSRPSFRIEITSPRNFQYLSSLIKFSLFFMTLLNAILLNQPAQYIPVFNILMGIIIFLVHLKFCSNMSGVRIHCWKKQNHFLKLSFNCFLTSNVFNVTCCIKMDSFSVTFKTIILVTIYIFLYLQNKSFLGRVHKYFIYGNYCGKSTKQLAILLRFFFSITYVFVR